MIRRVTTAALALFVATTPAPAGAREVRTDPGAPPVASSPEPVALLGTDWRIVGFGEFTLGEAKGGPVMRLDPATRRFAAMIGCNRFMGGYALDGDALSFTRVASTMMACPPPLDAQERSFVAALETVTGWRVEGATLELIAEGAPLVRLEAYSAP